MLVNAAGLGAQKIMEMVEAESLFTITPKRGQYYVLAKRSQPYVSHVLYPAPSKAGKGVLAVPTIHGNILLGPTSEILKKDVMPQQRQAYKKYRKRWKKSFNMYLIKKLSIVTADVGLLVITMISISKNQEGARGFFI